jgi:hypothetical protein
MEKILTDMEAVLAAFAKEEIKTPHLSVAKSLVEQAAQRIAAHVVAAKQIAAEKAAAPQPEAAAPKPETKTPKP